jgi:hypothetical protein
MQQCYKSISSTALYFHKYRAKTKKQASADSSSGSSFAYSATVKIHFWRLTVHSSSIILFYSNRLYKPFFLPFISFPRFFFSLLTFFSVLSTVLSLFSPFSPSVLYSSPLSFVDFLVVVGLMVGLGFGLGGLGFVRGFGFWSRRRSGFRFA